MHAYVTPPEQQAVGSYSVDILKCVKCRKGYASPPIILCKTGHLLCSECSGSRHCSFCRKSFQKTRCTELEVMAEKMLKPCQWGCNKWMPPDEVETHQKHCDLKKHSCMNLVGFGNCLWEGTRKELKLHLLRQHSSIISDNVLHNFVIKDYSQVQQFSATRILTCFSHIFLAKLMYSSANRAFYGGVQFLSGPPKVSKVFRYEFEIGKETASNMSCYKFIFSRQTHTISEDYSDSSFSDTCNQFWFSKDTGNFFTDIDDTLTVTVIVKSVQSLAMMNVEATKTYGFVPSNYCQKCVGKFNVVPPL